MKKLLKSKEISEDDEKSNEKITNNQDNHIKLIDDKVILKERNDYMNPLNHVAIIMDGNGRWGMKHYKSRNKGHRAGLNM